MSYIVRVYTKDNGYEYMGIYSRMLVTEMRFVELSNAAIPIDRYEIVAEDVTNIEEDVKYLNESEKITPKLKYLLPRDPIKNI